MTIRIRILSAFAALTVLMGVFGAFAISRLGQVRDDSTRAEKAAFEPLRAITDAQHSWDGAQIILGQLPAGLSAPTATMAKMKTLLEALPEATQPVAKTFLQNLGQYGQHLQEAEKLPLSAATRSQRRRRTGSRICCATRSRCSATVRRACAST